MRPNSRSGVTSKTTESPTEPRQQLPELLAVKFDGRVADFFDDGFGGKDAKAFFFDVKFNFKVVKVFFIKMSFVKAFER